MNGPRERRERLDDDALPSIFHVPATKPSTSTTGAPPSTSFFTACSSGSTRRRSACAIRSSSHRERKRIGARSSPSASGARGRSISSRPSSSAKRLSRIDSSAGSIVLRSCPLHDARSALVAGPNAARYRLTRCASASATGGGRKVAARNRTPRVKPHSAVFGSGSSGIRCRSHARSRRLSTSPAGPRRSSRNATSSRAARGSRRTCARTAVTSSGAGFARPFDHGATSLRRAVA